MLELLYNITIFPIEEIINFLFSFFMYAFDDIWFGIFIVSFFVNLMCLPMYMQAEKLQNEELEVRKKMDSQIKSIKKNFKGDEQFMMLRTCYRQHNYHPIMALRTSLSLLIQIPFFTAAYLYFSNSEILQNANLWGDKTLAQPDGLISIFGITINILPILMTAINLISAEIYANKKPLKDKIQMYSFAFIFLVLLYNSPMGLVIYWTFNNLFSLIKNIGLKQKSPAAFLKGLCIFICFGLLFKIIYSQAKYSYFGDCENNIFILLPILYIIFSISNISFIKKIKDFLNEKLFDTQINSNIFWLSTILFCLWEGIFIPLLIMSSSTGDFSFVREGISPFYFTFDLFSHFLGVSLWLVILYYLFEKRGKNTITIISLTLVIISVINTLITTPKIGILPENLSLQNINTTDLIQLNIYISLLIIILILSQIKRLYFKNVLIIMIITTLFSIAFNSFKTEKAYISLKKDFYYNSNENPYIEISKEGKNVFVIVMDAAIGVYAKEIFEENEDLRKQFSGFVLYPNCISYYGHTILGYPPITGGYEYTPVNLDKRVSEKNVDKYNEAITVLPLIFANNGYDSLVINPKMPDWITNSNGKSVYAPKKIKSYRITNSLEINKINIIKKNLLDLTLFISSPNSIKNRMLSSTKKEKSINEDILPESIKQIEYPNELINQYKELISLNEIITFNKKQNTFTMYHNNLAHLDLYDTDRSKEFYIVHEEMFKALNKLFEYLKTNNVYDNTKIIIVSDHGRHRKKNKYLKELYTDYNPLLMVKDFNAKNDLKTDMKFMTNADVPVIATENTIENAINPYSGKSLKEQTDKSNVIIISDNADTMTGSKYNAEDFTGNKIIDKKMDKLKVKNNIFDEGNWTLIEGQK